MAELEGVLRALSFLGLGAALVGLGYAYREFSNGPSSIIQIQRASSRGHLRGGVHRARRHQGFEYTSLQQ